MMYAAFLAAVLSGLVVGLALAVVFCRLWHALANWVREAWRR